MHRFDAGDARLSPSANFALRYGRTRRQTNMPWALRSGAAYNEAVVGISCVERNEAALAVKRTRLADHAE